jgi:hypothetical protein
MQKSEVLREKRRRVLKGATIILTNNQSEIRCTVRNQHNEGAELHVPGLIALPVEFLLYIPLDGQAYRSVVRWRKGERIGVEFTGTEPKPRRHYG